ncbi:MAG: glycosyltransferase family 2 protein [Lachnospiraceae bacterium]
MSELVSVIMSTYNEEVDWVRKSIESILNQTYSNLEFIIVLDNPENKVLKSVLQEYEHADSRVRILYNETNMGLVSSLNKALMEVKGVYVARMDADDISYPERLECQMNALKERNADFVMSSVDYLYENGELDRNTFEKEYFGKSFARIQKIGNVSAHPTWLIKTRLYKDLNGYRHVECCEDVDFLLRALQSGAVCLRMSQHLLQYRMRRTGISKSRGLEQFIRMRYIRKMYRKGNSLESITSEQWNRDFDMISEKQIEKFNCAMQLLWKGKDAFKNNHIIRCFLCVFRAMFTSGYFVQYFFDNIRWMAAVRIM